MRRFKSAAHLQRFLSVHGLVQNLPRGPTSAAVDPPPVVEEASVSGLERGDLGILSERRRSVLRQRTALT